MDCTKEKLQVTLKKKNKKKPQHFFCFSKHCNQVDFLMKDFQVPSNSHFIMPIPMYDDFVFTETNFKILDVDLFKLSPLGKICSEGL